MARPAGSVMTPEQEDQRRAGHEFAGEGAKSRALDEERQPERESKSARSVWREKSRSSSMSCPFAGMTRIRFKGSPPMRSLSSLWELPSEQSVI